MIVLLALALAAGRVLAADAEKKAPSRAPQAQQDKMKSCNAEAGSKALNDERQALLSDGLKAK